MSTQAASTARPAPGSAPRRALHIDDDAVLALLLRKLAARHGVELDHAANGREGLERMARQPYALVLVDLMLPQLDGLSLLHRLPPDPAQRRVVLSARADAQTRAHCERAGASEFIAKPAPLARLNALFEELP